MNVLDGLKTLYSALGGSEVDLEELSSNKYQNMHNVFYGDGLSADLSVELEDKIMELANGSHSGNVVELYKVNLPDTPPDAEYSEYSVRKQQDYFGLSLTKGGSAVGYFYLKELVELKGIEPSSQVCKT